MLEDTPGKCSWDALKKKSFRLVPVPRSRCRFLVWSLWLAPNCGKNTLGAMLGPKIARLDLGKQVFQWNANCDVRVSKISGPKPDPY